jgi:hypothetical protein
MSELEYWERQPTDQPWLLNGFNGTWTFTDHDLIPGALRNFINESFPKHERFRRIPLDEINALMNDVWEGPGSMSKIQKLYIDMRVERLGKTDIGVKTQLPKMIDAVRTIDDYDENEFSEKVVTED